MRALLTACLDHYNDWACEALRPHGHEKVATYPKSIPGMRDIHVIPTHYSKRSHHPIAATKGIHACCTRALNQGPSSCRFSRTIDSLLLRDCLINKEGQSVRCTVVAEERKEKPDFTTL